MDTTQLIGVLLSASLCVTLGYAVGYQMGLNKTDSLSDE